MVFAEGYSDQYDNFYRDKDYIGECDFLEEIFRSRGRLPETVLDLGCGTGGHALILQERGFRVTAVDRSRAMLERAKRKAGGGEPRFLLGDIVELRLEARFDAVIAMFAVIGYQTEAEALSHALSSVYDHLKPGGLFIFDGWYGPAVLHQSPGERIKETGDPKGEWSIRLAKPSLDALRQIVSIRYRVLTGRGKQILQTFEEVHTMRFFFPEETRLLLEGVGFSDIQISPFMALHRDITSDDWNMAVVARKPES